MISGLDFFAGLDSDDADWLLATGSERQIIANTLLIEEGKATENLYVVLDGLLEVRNRAFGAVPIANLGPGEMLGEISFLTGDDASASISAVENSLVLVIPFDAVNSRIKSDDAFAARLFRSMATLNACRLRDRVKQLLSRSDTREVDTLSGAVAAENPIGDEITAIAQALKEEFRNADKEALSNDNQVPEALADTIVVKFRAACERINDLVGDASGIDDATRRIVGARVQAEILPYLLMTRTAERFYSKPRGYAGDFMTIKWIYENQPAGTGRLGALIDRCFLEEPSAVAVRNRRGLLHKIIEQVVVENHAEESIRITSLACGPAEEIFDTFLGEIPSEKLKATLIDIDLQALDLVTERRDLLRLQDSMDLQPGNLLYLALGRQKLDIPPQHLVYSIGLIDYFNDKFVIKLLNYIHGLLAPGGRVVLGNFHPANSSKAFMDHVLEWRLIHRDEDDMNRLFEQSDFNAPCDAIHYEEQRINLFAEGVKKG